MADIGFKMSIPGIDTSKTTDFRQQVFWSKYNPLMIVKYGQTQLTVNSNAGNTLTIAHGLGYSPLALRYYDIDNNGRFWLQGTRMGNLSTLSTGVNGGGNGNEATDRNNLTFSGISQAANPNYTMPIRYVLFNESTFDPVAGNDQPIGYNSSNVGFKISRSGVDVRNAKLYQQVANSNCDFLKFHSTSVIDISFNILNNGEASQDFVHGLGYVPLFTAFGYFDNDVRERQMPVGVSPQNFVSSAFADTNKITVEICWAGSGVSETHHFYARIVVFKNNMLNT